MECEGEFSFWANDRSARRYARHRRTVDHQAHHSRRFRRQPAGGGVGDRTDVLMALLFQIRAEGALIGTLEAELILAGWSELGGISRQRVGSR